MIDQSFLILVGHGFSEHYLLELDLEHYTLLVERHHKQYMEDTVDESWRQHFASQASSKELKKFLKSYEPANSAPDQVANPQQVAAAFGAKLIGM